MSGVSWVTREGGFRAKPIDGCPSRLFRPVSTKEVDVARAKQEATEYARPSAAPPSKQTEATSETKSENPTDSAGTVAHEVLDPDFLKAVGASLGIDCNGSSSSSAAQQETATKTSAVSSAAAEQQTPTEAACDDHAAAEQETPTKTATGSSAAAELQTPAKVAKTSSAAAELQTPAKVAKTSSAAAVQQTPAKAGMSSSAASGQQAPTQVVSGSKPSAKQSFKTKVAKKTYLKKKKSKKKPNEEVVTPAIPVGFGGKTNKAPECRICKHPRPPHQDGAVCKHCPNAMRNLKISRSADKLLASGNQELIDNVVKLSKEKRRIEEEEHRGSQQQEGIKIIRAMAEKLGVDLKQIK
eukprot:TRINITY_DN42594_c0_g1_i2.p1 TRINITY_DN42594_c0_g1~~TRINITY_DN42594_c0_g1_i2.p1  ORF type:complete len:362 (-),score=118.75 TRINITY_DN42594_c0_g1_i2:62-1123(-)